MLSLQEQTDLRRYIAALYGYHRNPDIQSRREREKIDRCYRVILSVYAELQNQRGFSAKIAKAAQQMNLGEISDLRAPIL